MPHCSVTTCDLPALCRPVLVVRERSGSAAAMHLELPLILCCRHGRPGPVERYLSPSSRKRIGRELRAHGIQIDWRRSGIEWTRATGTLSPAPTWVS